MVKKQETKVSTIENEDIELLSRADACRFLHVSQSMLDAHLSIPKVRIGRKVLYTKSATWTNIVAELIGGTEDENRFFSFSSSDPTIIQLFSQNEVAQIRGLKAGSATLTVTHPRAEYSEQITIIIDEVVSTNCSISVPENLITMKPTDSGKSITANLINGSFEDRYNFSWELDVYDVIDLRYSNNTAVITPLFQGDCVLTVTHPKSAYPQQIKIKVSEYTNFNFSVTNKTLTEGKSAFISMQVPASSTTQHIVYRSENDSICKITGTSKVCQITGIKAGTTRVFADLVNTATNIIKSTSELLISVEQGNADITYITASQDIYNIEKGSNRTLSASLAGSNVLPTDQANLTWFCSDSSVISLKGISTTGYVTGSSVLVEAIGSGEATITISHPKSTSDFSFLIIVPGSNQQNITLSKSYMSMQKGTSLDLKATLTNAKLVDYKNIVWTAANDVNNTEICRILGSGQTVNIFGINTGTTDIIAELPNGNKAVCEVNVYLPRHFTFDRDSVKIMPGEVIDIPFSFSPSTATISYFSSDNTVFSFVENANNTVSITGLKLGTGTLTAVTSSGQKDMITVAVDWQYKFTVNSHNIRGNPTESVTIDYDIFPLSSEISIFSDNDALDRLTYNIDEINKKIVITPLTEIDDTLFITAKNKANNEVFDTEEVSIKCKYNYLSPIVNLITKDGLFSKIDNNLIHIGDGETVELSIEMAEPMSDYSITNFSIKKLSTSSPDISQTSLLSGNGVKTGKVLINASGTNFVNKEYFIPIWYYPVTTKVYSKYTSTDDIVYWGKPQAYQYGATGNLPNGQPFQRFDGSFNNDLIYKGRSTYLSDYANDDYESLLYYIPSLDRYIFLGYYADCLCADEHLSDTPCIHEAGGNGCICPCEYGYGRCSGNTMFLPVGDELAINPFMEGTPGYYEFYEYLEGYYNTGLVNDELVTLYFYDTNNENPYWNWEMKSIATLRPENWAWKKVHPNIVNTRMSINDYRSSPFYWNKATNSTTNFLPATLVDDDDITLLSSENNYMLQIHYLHFGQIKMIEIPIYIDVRNCNITLN